MIVLVDDDDFQMCVCLIYSDDDRKMEMIIFHANSGK